MVGKKRLFPANNWSGGPGIEPVASGRDGQSIGSKLCLHAWKLKESPVGSRQEEALAGPTGIRMGFFTHSSLA